MGVIVDVLSNTASNHNGFPVVESTDDIQVPGPQRVGHRPAKPVASGQLLPPPTLMGSHTLPCVPVKKGIFGGMVIGT